MKPNSDSKKCPFCKEIIKKDAIKCRYCGEFLDKQQKLSEVKAKKTAKGKRLAYTVRQLIGALFWFKLSSEYFNTSDNSSQRTDIDNVYRIYTSLTEYQKADVQKMILPLLCVNSEQYYDRSGQDYKNKQLDEHADTALIHLLTQIVRYYDNTIKLDENGFFRDTLFGFSKKYLSSYEIEQLVDKAKDSLEKFDAITYKNSINELSDDTINDLVNASYVMWKYEKTYTNDNDLNDDYWDLMIQERINKVEEVFNKGTIGEKKLQVIEVLGSEYMQKLFGKTFKGDSADFEKVETTLKEEKGRFFKFLVYGSINIFGNLKFDEVKEDNTTG